MSIRVVLEIFVRKSGKTPPLRAVDRQHHRTPKGGSLQKDFSLSSSSPIRLPTAQRAERYLRSSLVIYAKFPWQIDPSRGEPVTSVKGPRRRFTDSFYSDPGS